MFSEKLFRVGVSRDYFYREIQIVDTPQSLTTPINTGLRVGMI